MYAILRTVSSCILCVSFVCQNRDANRHNPHSFTPWAHTSPPTDVSFPVDSNLTNYLVASFFILVCDLLLNSLFCNLSLRITYNNNVSSHEDVS